MKETLKEFEDLCMHPCLRHAAMALVMNKMDLLAAKLTRSPLANHFPDYSGADEPIAASGYLIQVFTTCWSENVRRDAQVWRTNTIDSDLMPDLLRDVGEFIWRRDTQMVCGF
ncbi:hypothetical protein B0H11DRAFT_1944862 [Mycena galericulata]|nr:hypothetical protein B0H11DRAFT_1944862 [Mycena galericulata]